MEFEPKDSRTYCDALEELSAAIEEESRRYPAILEDD